MILNKYISELVTCRDCRYADLQDYFRLYDFSGDGHDIHFICDPCYDKRCPAPLPESFREHAADNLYIPAPAEFVTFLFCCFAIFVLCLASAVYGGGK